MTNEEFLGHLEDELIAMEVNPTKITHNPLFRHARKLAAVAEAAKATYGATFDVDDGEGDGFYVGWEDYMALGKALKELQGE